MRGRKGMKGKDWTCGKGTQHKQKNTVAFLGRDCVGRCYQQWGQ